MTKTTEAPKIIELEPKSVEKAVGVSIEEMQATSKKQMFVDGYKMLCRETGLQISGEPFMKPMNDLGGYIISVQLVLIPFVGRQKEQDGI